jgi:hypothetical protein
MAVSMKFRVFWDVVPCSHVEDDGRFRGAYWALISLIMEAVCTSETSVTFSVSMRRYIPEDSKLHTSNSVTAKASDHYIQLSCFD